MPDFDAEQNFDEDEELFVDAVLTTGDTGVLLEEAIDDGLLLVEKGAEEKETTLLEVVESPGTETSC
jgi:hypothetical protein